MTRKGFLAAAGTLAATLAASRLAFAQTRGEVGSARNIWHVRSTLEGLIDQLQHDQADYGGFRVRAIAAMQEARNDLIMALEWDITHSH